MKNKKKVIAAALAAAMILTTFPAMGASALSLTCPGTGGWSSMQYDATTGNTTWHTRMAPSSYRIRTVMSSRTRRTQPPPRPSLSPQLLPAGRATRILTLRFSPAKRISLNLPPQIPARSMYGSARPVCSPSRKAARKPERCTTKSQLSERPVQRLEFMSPTTAAPARNFVSQPSRAAAARQQASPPHRPHRRRPQRRMWIPRA